MKIESPTIITTSVPQTRIFHIKLKQKILALVITFFCLALSVSPVTVEAGWSDDGITKIKENVKNLFDTINDAKTTISDSKLKNMISDIKGMLKTAVDTQQDGISTFISGGGCGLNDGTPCGNFKGDLTQMLQTFEDVNNTLLNFHNIPLLNIQVEDPGLATLIVKIPGRVLFPMYKVMMKTHLLDSGLMQALEDTKLRLDDLKYALYQNTSSISSVSLSAIPSSLEICQSIDERSTTITVAATAVKGVGYVAKLVGTLFKTTSETVLAGPVEMDAGIHGYVHGTMYQNTQSALGKAISGIGGLLVSISTTASTKVTSCRGMVQQAISRGNQEAILANQALYLSNQEAILLGQRRTLCAFKHNLPDTCAEFVGNSYGNRGKN